MAVEIQDELGVHVRHTVGSVGRIVGQVPVDEVASRENDVAV